MLNQLFPYPILKVQPNSVRIYTHFSTAAVELKGSVMNNTEDLKRIKDEFLKILTEGKKLKSSSELLPEDIQEIKNKFNLPDKLNDKLLFNLEVN